MSINLRCVLERPNQDSTPIELTHTPSSVTYRILQTEGGWKKIALSYLAWVNQTAGPSSKKPDLLYVKRQRQIIGEAWKMAENAGGYLVFYGT